MQLSLDQAEAAAAAALEAYGQEIVAKEGECDVLQKQIAVLIFDLAQHKAKHSALMAALDRDKAPIGAVSVGPGSQVGLDVAATGLVAS